jgi:hypothetical protein
LSIEGSDVNHLPPVVPIDSFSHGTLETRSVDKVRPFLTDFLGLDSVRVAREAVYVYRGGPWLVVCVEVGDALKPQRLENRWCVAVASSEEPAGEARTRSAVVHAHALRQVSVVLEVFIHYRSSLCARLAREVQR